MAANELAAIFFEIRFASCYCVLLNHFKSDLKIKLMQNAIIIANDQKPKCGGIPKPIGRKPHR